MKPSDFLCDIIIPVWNQWSLTEACLLSVIQKTKISFRFILVDNGSEEETRRGLEKIARDPALKTILLRNEKNLGYVKAINQGLVISTAPFVCLLNNDVVVTPGWLEKMISFAESRPDAGLVNCLQNDNPGREVPEDLGAFARAQIDRPHTWEELDHCSGNCLLIKREVIEKIGYFDEQFGLGHWEDNDYSRRAQQAGYRCLRLRDTYIWHHLASSFEKISRWREGIEKNRELFYGRWGKPLRVIYPVSEGLDLRRARFNQILQTAHALAQQGCEVELLSGRNKIGILDEALPYFGLERHQNLRVHPIPMLRMAETGPIRLSWNGVFLWNCLLKIRGLLRDREYDALYVRHLELANFLLNWQDFLKLPIIFEAHEIFHLTTERKEKERKIWRQEMRLYHRANGVVAITRGLAEKIQEVFGVSTPIEVIPDGVNIGFFQRTAYRSPNHKILYVGQLYPWKGIGILIEAMSYLRERCLHVVGGSQETVEKWKKRSMEMKIQDRVLFHGQVSPREVRVHLQEAAVAVLPLTQDLISASFTSPLKLFEYMAAGVPIVASDLPSTREILTPEVNAVLVPPNNPQALAAGIQRVLEDRDLANRIAQKALEDVMQFSWKKRAEKIIIFLHAIRGERTSFPPKVG